MSFRKLINRRRYGFPSGFIECASNALDGDSSKFSRQATQDTEEFDWETLDDNTNVNWNEFIVTLGKISSLKRDRALLPAEFRSDGCLLHEAISLGAPDDGEFDILLNYVNMSNDEIYLMSSHHMLLSLDVHL